jgi:hypothetical protein
MITFQVVPVRPAYMGQSITVTPPTTPTVVTPPTPPSQTGVPVYLIAGVIGGAVLGWGLSMVAPKIDSKMKMDGPKKLYGTIGGAVGGLAGVATTLLLKG